MKFITKKLTEALIRLGVSGFDAPMVAGIIFVAAGFLFVCVLCGAIFYNCSSNRTERKKANLNANIQNGKFEANLISNKINEQQSNTKNAAVNFNAVVNTDSANFDGSSANDRFCARFSNDSSCAEWRRARGLQ